MYKNFDLSQIYESHPGSKQYLEFYNRDKNNNIDCQSPIEQICARIRISVARLEIINPKLELKVSLDNEECFSKIDVSQFSSGSIQKTWYNSSHYGTLYFDCPINHPDTASRVYDFIQYIDLKIALLDPNTKHQLLTSLSHHIKDVKIEDNETVYHNLTIQAQNFDTQIIFKYTKMLYECEYHQAWYVLAQAYEAAHNPEMALMALSALDDIRTKQENLRAKQDDALAYQNAMFLKANILLTFDQPREAFIALTDAGDAPDIIQFRTRHLESFLGGSGFDEQFPLITMRPDMVIDMASQIMDLQKQVLFLESQQNNPDSQYKNFIGYLSKKQPDDSHDQDDYKSIDFQKHKNI